MTKSSQSHLPTDSALRKEMPICEGLLDYFPDAAAYVSRISFLGNEKHNPGEPLHWARGKSMDQDDCIVRHTIERGTFDPDDGALHDGKRAWRAFAALQLEIERRIEAGEPLWDEEVIAANRAAQKAKLAATARDELAKRAGAPPEMMVGSGPAPKTTVLPPARRETIEEVVRQVEGDEDYPCKA